MECITNLFEHQKRCVEKLRRIKIGALYLEMGTGKTRTALELIKIRLEKGRVNHVIWLCPCSVKENLRRDLIKHTGSECSDIITICGIETLSSSIKTNTDLLKLVNNKECYLIVDESNLVKNFKAKRTENIIRLAENCKYKLILNGTPITKKETDLFSQWYILDWRILGYKSFWSFAANHIEYDERIRGKVVRCLNVDYLTEKIAPYSYQVKKDECLDLPQKMYDTKYYALTPEQEIHYQCVADSLLFSLDELKPYTIYRFLTALQDVISGFYVDTTGIKCDSSGNLKKYNFFDNPLDNPRINLLMNMLDGLSCKTIIFCKYTQEINDICKAINDKYGEDVAIPFNGELNVRKRNENINKFKDQSQFLIANKNCGAYGLNLQFCSYVIYYSNDWNYGTRAQSEDRVHRIGQCENVLYVDICAAYTLDERILKCLENKEDLVDSFKAELERTKDKEELFAWIQKKDSQGCKYRKRIKNLDRGDLLD